MIVHLVGSKKTKVTQPVLNVVLVNTKVMWVNLFVTIVKSICILEKTVLSSVSLAKQENVPHSVAAIHVSIAVWVNLVKSLAMDVQNVQLDLVVMMNRIQLNVTNVMRG